MSIVRDESEYLLFVLVVALLDLDYLLVGLFPLVDQLLSDGSDFILEEVILGEHLDVSAGVDVDHFAL